MPKLNLASSQRVKVRVIEYTQEEVAQLAQNPVTLALLTIGVNDDRRQKVALVDFRSDLSDKIAELGFSRKTRQETKGTEVKTVPDETEGDHIGRFVDALVSGAFTHEAFAIPTGDDKVKETAALVHLQRLAYECGDEKTDDGLPCYKLDINRVVSERKGPAIPKWATEQATTIITKGGHASLVKNATKFREGFTNQAGVVIDPFPFEDFTELAPAHADAAAKEAHHQVIVKRLAKALQTYDAQVKAKTKADVEFI